MIACRPNWLWVWPPLLSSSNNQHTSSSQTLTELLGKLANYSQEKLRMYNAHSKLHAASDTCGYSCEMKAPFIQ